jgi:hypothetical protein
MAEEEEEEEEEEAEEPLVRWLKVALEWITWICKICVKVQ